MPELPPLKKLGSFNFLLHFHQLEQKSFAANAPSKKVQHESTHAPVPPHSMIIRDIGPNISTDIFSQKGKHQNKEF